MRVTKRILWTAALTVGAASLLLVGGAEADIVHADDVIILRSLCVGFDCVNGEVFGADTIRLRENNLRIHFDDTSSAASFPTRNWRIVVNDSANGGASYFAVEDADASRHVFKVEANAPSNALYVDSGGRVGLGTSNPVLELHVVNGDTPALRLDQDGSSGFAPQVWDVAGNETSFFVRDATNGSTLPFRIQPGVGSNLLFLDADERVGIGTTAPDETLHVRKTNDTAMIHVEDTGGGGNLRMLTLTKANAAPFMRFESTFGNWDFVAGNLFVISDPTTGVNEFQLSRTGDLTIQGQCSEGASGSCADYVFEEDYPLRPLSELAQFIADNKHLPNVPSTEEIKKNGLNLQQFQGRLLEKIEELTLYTLDQQETIEALEARLAALEAPASE